MCRLLATVLAPALLAVLAPAALAGSLPTVSSGQRPGPPLLYAPAPNAPQLSVQAPFSAAPLLVSGTDAYRGGEYLYQDYLFDDQGADTAPGGASSSKAGPDTFSPSAGDVVYPTAERFANNAADLVELRIKPTADAVVYRITLNTAKTEDTAVVGIGIDTDRSGGLPVAWPGGAGISSPGLDRFITAWGTGGKVTSFPGGTNSALPAGAVTLDLATNQMTVRVPRSLMDPGSATWRYTAGVGLRDGEGFRAVATGGQATSETPASGSAAGSAPAVFNLAFRFDEPTTKEPRPPFTTFPGIGNFFEDKQSRALAGRSTSAPPGTGADFHADVDFAKLAAAAEEQIHASPQFEQARIYASGLDLPEGVRGSFPEFGGQLQPYLLTVPTSYRPGKPAGLTFSLHSLGGTYTQYSVFSPKQQRQFGEERDNFVVTTLGHGSDGWYTSEAEVDFFEAWADVARNFDLDSERVSLTGYSMGGYGTYKLGAQYPDLFGNAFTTVGPPGLGIWPVVAPPTGGQDTLSNLLLENVRSVPFLNWVAAEDDLVPYAGPVEQQTGRLRGRGFDTLGLRSLLETFQGEHFTLTLLDEWGAARDFLGDVRVTRDPGRVDYALLPAADRQQLGLVHNHAYWVSALRARDTGGNPETDPATCPPVGGCPPRAEISARSLAFGEGDPVLRRVDTVGTINGRPQPSQIQGTEWASVPRVPAANRLTLDLENMAAATISGRRARLEGSKPLRVRLKSDGASSVRLNLPLPKGATVRRIDGGPLTASAAGAGSASPEVALSRRGAVFTVAAGTREYLISQATGSGKPRGDRPGRGGRPRGGPRSRPRGNSRCANQRNEQRRSQRDRQRCGRVGVGRR